MDFEVIITPHCIRQIKRLSKKHASLKSDMQRLVAELAKDPGQGTLLGKGLYKIRMSIASKGKGRSGGARVITCVFVTDLVVYVAAVYDKSEQSTLTDKELLRLRSALG